MFNAISTAQNIGHEVATNSDLASESSEKLFKNDRFPDLYSRHNKTEFP